MDKVEIITEELRKIRVRYLGLTMPMRTAILKAMVRYAFIKKPLARVLIKKECRETHGVEGAFNEACKEMKKNYLLFAESPLNKNVTWTIELNTSKE